MKWQPIETAPRTTNENYFSRAFDDPNRAEVNVPILAWGKPFFDVDQSLGDARMFVLYWSTMHDKWIEQMQGMTDEGLSAYEIIPTHWMPLPEPPK